MPYMIYTMEHRIVLLRETTNGGRLLLCRMINCQWYGVVVGRMWTHLPVVVERIVSIEIVPCLEWVVIRQSFVRMDVGTVVDRGRQ